MAGFPKFAGLLAVALFAWATPSSAQVAGGATSLAATAPRPARQAARDANPLARWLCAGGIEMEIRPVSYDGPTKSDEWVVIYRRNGVAYSAERMNRKAAEAVPVDSCHASGRVG